MKKVLLTTGVCLGLMVSAIAQNTSAVWKQSSEAALSQKSRLAFDKHFKPAAYKLFQLNENSLQSDLNAAPSEKALPISASGKIITVPAPDGSLQQFRFVESSVMAPKLASKYSNIKSYIGQNVANAAATIRFDFSPYGFHAMVMQPGKPTYYINPLDKENRVYVVNARNTADNSKGFDCTLDEKAFTNIAPELLSIASGLTGNADQGKLRVYDLALCVNAEFSQVFLDGSEPDSATKVNKVMAVLVTCITRANAVYERDFGVRLSYVANQDTLVFLNANTDPWPTKPPLLGSSWNSKTQQTIDARIGAGNYDIGHLLGKVPTFADNNGNAGCIGCVCTNGSKGSGFTAYYDPTLIDYMVIDYWTHEMGHQFGANHTFTYSNENSGANVEPGSGSTIMGYAGITGSTDVQPHSDDLFHAVNIAQVSNYTETGNGNTCAVTTVTGNTAPTANAGLDYTIPASTPFLLTGSGSDVDAGDALTYIWEQTDIFEKTTSNKFPLATSTTGPLFRVYNDTTLPVRAFPALSTILAGQTGTTWEVLPGVARDMNFRFTVRDNHAGAGNNMSDDMKVTVAATAGPFVVTQPNTAVNWNGGSQQTITWDVASTNLAPINCTNVKISLSTDGGLTFPTVLSASTANDGTELVTLPNISSSTCRIKVEAVGNIFFDISNTNFTITSVVSSCPGTFDTNNNNTLGSAVAIPLNTDVKGTISTSTDKDFYSFTITNGGTITVTLGTLPANYNLSLYNSAKTIVASSNNTGTNSETINFTTVPGVYYLRVLGKGGATDAANCYTLKVATGTASKQAGIAAVTNAEQAVASVQYNVKMYPNPVDNVLNISLPSYSANSEVRLFDAYGKLVAAKKVTQNLVQMNVNRLFAGVYFVKVVDANGAAVYNASFIKK